MGGGSQQRNPGDQVMLRSLQEDGFPQEDEGHYTVGEAWDDKRIFMAPAATLIKYLEARKWGGERRVRTAMVTVADGRLRAQTYGKSVSVGVQGFIIFIMICDLTS